MTFRHCPCPPQSQVNLSCSELMCLTVGHLGNCTGWSQPCLWTPFLISDQNGEHTGLATKDSVPSPVLPSVCPQTSQLTSESLFLSFQDYWLGVTEGLATGLGP